MTDSDRRFIYRNCVWLIQATRANDVRPLVLRVQIQLLRVSVNNSKIAIPDLEILLT